MKKKNLFTILIYILLVAFIVSFIIIYYFNKLLSPSLIKSASYNVERITSVVVSNCVKKYLSGDVDLDLVEVIKGSNDRIELIRYNTSDVNKISMDISDLVLEDINYLALGEFERIDFVLPNITEKYYKEISDGIVFGISIGNIFNNNFMANIGPRIPLKMNLNQFFLPMTKNRVFRQSTT